jgi:hypothetical protein
VVEQQLRQTLQCTRGGFAADTCINNGMIGVTFRQSVGHEGHPALFQRHTIGCTDTIA